MTETLKNELCIYLGELIYQYEHSNYWVEKNELADKINSIHCLLDINVQYTKWHPQLNK